MDRQRTFLLGLIGALLAVSALFVLPFLDYFLLAVILSYVLRPVQIRLERQVSERIAAGLIVFGAAVTIIVPLMLVVRTTIVEGRRLLDRVRAGEATFANVEASIVEVTGMDVDLSAALQELVRDLGIGAFSDIVSLVGTLAHVAIGLGLTLFLLYYFVKDGDRFVAWLRAVLPMSEANVAELFLAVDQITWAVLAGHLFVAIIQGMLAGLGLVVVGVPNAFFWTVVMIVLSLLPIIGSFMVWGPAALWLLIVGEPVAAVGLAVYGTVVVGISDDYLRPVVVDRYAKVSPAVIIIGVLGGIYAIGFMGIFIGPIVIGSLKATLDVYHRELTAGA